MGLVSKQAVVPILDYCKVSWAMGLAGQMGAGLVCVSGVQRDKETFSPEAEQPGNVRVPSTSSIFIQCRLNVFPAQGRMRLT